MFHLWYLFLPLITYRYQFIDLILLWFILRMLSMLTLVQKANEQDQSSYIFRYKFGKSLNTLASNNVSLWTYKIMSFIKISKSLQTLFACLLPASVISQDIAICKISFFHFFFSPFLSILFNFFCHWNWKEFVFFSIFYGAIDFSFRLFC